MVKADASWVMVTWRSRCEQTDTTENITLSQHRRLGLLRTVILNIFRDSNNISKLYYIRSNTFFLRQCQCKIQYRRTGIY